MPSRTDIARIRRFAREKCGFDALRSGQEEAIQALLDGHDVLSVMPTGSGKSAIYQIAGMMIDGPTVVVSPLIALQKDQVDSICEHELPEARVVNSTLKAAERREALQRLREGDLEYLFVSPEQLANEETLAHVLAEKPRLFVVDEAHCISEWGHDFRPDYMKLGTLIEALDHPRVLALTATAGPPVRREIIERLHMANVRQVIHGFDRPNIRLSVERCDDQQTKQRTVLLLVQKFKRPGIVYVATRGHAEEIAAMLTAHEQPAVAYHAGLPKAQRTTVQDDFMNDRAPLIVATNAFGMGVDKPDVRFVIHYDIPEALDAYYQEVGRAGRDGEPAEAVLLYREEDLGIRRAMAGTTKITAEQVKTVAETIESKPEPVKPADIKDETGLPKSKVTAAIQRLEDLGVVEQLPGGAVQAGDDAEIDEAAEQAAEEQERYRGQRQARVELMKAYAETSDCRRRVLLGYFGEEIGGPCGHCDNCETGKSAATEQHEQAADHPFALNSRVKHKELGEGLVLRYETGNIVVLFDEHGTKSLVLKYVVDHGLLSVA